MTKRNGKLLKKAGLDNEVAAGQRSDDPLASVLNRLQIFVEHAPVAMAMFDRQMHYLEVSNRWLHDYRLAERNLLGKSHYAIFPEIPEHWKAIHQRVLAGESLKSDEECFERVDGSVQWLRWEALPWYDAAGAIGGLILFTEDITEKKCLALQLQAERDRLTALIDSLADEVWLSDAQGQIQAVNAVAKARFGLSLQQASDLKLLAASLEIFRADGGLRPLEEAPPLQVLKTGQAMHNQVEIVRMPDTHEQCYRSVSATPLKDAEGNISGVVSVVRDITKQKQLTLELDQMRKQMQEGQRIAHLGTFEYLAATQTTVWSKEEYRLYGLDPTQPSPTYQEMLENCIHPDDAALLHQCFTKAMQHGAIYDLEHRIVRPDGSVLWVHDQAHPYFDESGKLLRYVGTTLDITERKRVELALIESEQRWQFALEGAGDGLWDWNAETNRVFFSKQWKAMLGFAEDEIGDSLEEWDKRVHPDDKAAAYQEIERLFSREVGIYHNEHRLCCKDGRYKWVLDRGKVMTWSPEGKPLRIIGTHTDITERKMAEQAQEVFERELNLQRSRIEEASHLQVAAQTAGAIAHELNQPLTAIVAYSVISSQLLLLASIENEELRENLEKIKSLAQHAGQSIRQILHVLHKTVAPLDQVNIHDVVDNVAGMLDLELSHFRIEQTIEPDFGFLRINRLQIEKILMNLFRNAMQAMRERNLTEGRIQVMARTLDGDPSMGQITVRDSGVGLDNEALEWVFQPFHTTKSNGLGLGLTIGRTLIEASGGKFWAEPNEGPGVSFHFTLSFFQ